MALPIRELLLRDSGDDDTRSAPRSRQRSARGADAPFRATPLLDIPDADVVAAIRAGDGRTFERLYTAYVTPLFDFAIAYVRETAIAEEIVATVFANLWTRRATWTVHDRIEPYLFGAVHREVLTILRKTRRQTSILTSADDETLAQSLGHAPPLPGEALEQDELEARVWRVIEALPTKYRTAMVLRWRRDMSYDDIAHVLNVSSDSARQLVSRAVRMIRAQVGV
jgi:RNA polymerase sigma-70 factor (ECF subfamily)